MADQILREFNGINDDDMLDEADTMIGLFNDDMTDFTNYDAELDSTFESAWQGKIDVARAKESDETVEDQISQLTDAVYDAWTKCKACFQDAKYFIEKAFPDNAGMQHEFGYNDYDRMTQNQGKVFPFMNQFHSVAEREHVKMIAAGFPQTKIDDIENKGKAFHEAQKKQEQAKKRRVPLTQERIIAMNDVWHQIQRVNRASKSVYRDNYAKLQIYMLPASGSNAPVADLAGTGNVSSSVDNTPIVGATVQFPNLGITATTDSNGNWGITAGVPAGSTPVVVTAPGMKVITDNFVIVDGETVTKNFVMSPL